MKPALVIVMAAAVIAVAFGYQFRHVYFLTIDAAALLQVNRFTQETCYIPAHKSYESFFDRELAVPKCPR